MYDNYLVTQSNDLIEARHPQTLTPTEHKMVLTFVSMIQPEDEDFKVYSMSVSDFHKLLNLKGRENYTQIKRLTKQLLTKTVEIEKENGGFLVSHWASHIEYIGGEGRIEFSFDPKLKPYLLQLKDAFKSYKLANILSLGSYYSIRLYELLKKWQNIGKWETRLDHARSLMGVHQKSYLVYGNFKNRILKPAIEDVNEKTDVYASFKEKKSGRKVIGLVFYIKSNHKNILDDKVELEHMLIEQENKDEDLNFDRELLDKLNQECLNFKITANVFSRIYVIANEMYDKQLIEYELLNLVKLTNDKATKNPIGFMLHVIESKYNNFKYGLDPSFDDDVTDYTKEVIPDWFKNRNKPVIEREQTAEELEREKKAEEEIKALLAKHQTVK